MIKIGILTMSDRASGGIYEDLSGKAIKDILKEWITSELKFDYRVIPDDLECIKEKFNIFK